MEDKELARSLRNLKESVGAISGSGELSEQFSRERMENIRKLTMEYLTGYGTDGWHVKQMAYGLLAMLAGTLEDLPGSMPSFGEQTDSEIRNVVADITKIIRGSFGKVKGLKY